MSSHTITPPSIPDLIVGEYAISEVDGAYVIAKKGKPAARVTFGVIEKIVRQAYESEF